MRNSDGPKKERRADKESRSTNMAHGAVPMRETAVASAEKPPSKKQKYSGKQSNTDQVKHEDRETRGEEKGKENERGPLSERMRATEGVTGETVLSQSASTMPLTIANTSSLKLWVKPQGRLADFDGGPG
eukprot:710441-Pleurochrysis_carterae.AAC.1